MSILAKFLLAKLTGKFGKKLFICLAEELAKMTTTNVDDKLVKAIKNAL